MTYKEKLEEISREIENLTDQEIEDFLEESSFADDFLSGAEWAFGRALKIFDDFGEDFILDKEDREEEQTYQCGSCEKIFITLKDNACPYCGSGNWVKGYIDDKEEDEDET